MPFSESTWTWIFDRNGCFGSSGLDMHNNKGEYGWNVCCNCRECYPWWGQQLRDHASQDTPSPSNDSNVLPTMVKNQKQGNAREEKVLKVGDSNMTADQKQMLLVFMLALVASENISSLRWCKLTEAKKEWTQEHDSELRIACTQQHWHHASSKHPLLRKWPLSNQNCREWADLNIIILQEIYRQREREREMLTTT